VVYVPALQKVFQTAPLTPMEIGVCAAVCAVVFTSVELEKLIVRALERRETSES